MTREGTTGEKLFALLVGFIAYGIVFVLAENTLSDTIATNFIWLGSVAVGIVASFATALVILKVRK